ncbi:hypothetical protein [Clostridium paraputrificum]|uniref:hypothetical protein n=1 Tax=Clostridium paraputrificum TaxID=29363 RepID=UPI000C070D4B|nr:hypothetical protein [Clostridium paraputrificum]
MIKDYQLLNFDNLFKLLSIFVTAFTTYFVTKYTSNRPRTLEIKSKQFNNVYLPLYRMLRKDFNKNISKEVAIRYSIKMKSILLNNFELAFPQLHDLNDLLFEAIKFDKEYQSIFNKICYQINLDYILLKKTLGYPSESTLSIFKRMNIHDKYTTIIEWTFNILAVLIAPFTITVYLFLSKPLSTLIVFIYLLITLLIILLNSLNNKNHNRITNNKTKM